MTFPEDFISTEPCHFGMFPSQNRFVSLSETVAQTQPDERGMVNPYKKPRPMPPMNVLQLV